MLAEMDVVMLHNIFPPLTIGLEIIIVYLEGMSLYSKGWSYVDQLTSGR